MVSVMEKAFFQIIKFLDSSAVALEVRRLLAKSPSKGMCDGGPCQEEYEPYEN